MVMLLRSSGFMSMHRDSAAVNRPGTALRGSRENCPLLRSFRFRRQPFGLGDCGANIAIALLASALELSLGICKLAPDCVELARRLGKLHLRGVDLLPSDHNLLQFSDLALLRSERPEGVGRALHGGTAWAVGVGGPVVARRRRARERVPRAIRSAPVGRPQPPRRSTARATIPARHEHHDPSLLERRPRGARDCGRSRSATVSHAACCSLISSGGNYGSIPAIS